MAGKRRLLTPEQEKWLVERYPNMTNAELIPLVETELGVSLTRKQLVNWAKRNDVRKSAATQQQTRMEVGKQNRVFDDEMVDFMREHVPGHVYPEVADAFEKRFGIRLNKHQYKNLLHRFDIKSGVRYGCFEKGHVPANKGKKWDDFMTPEAQERVRRSLNLFEKGHVPANAYHEILDERTDKYGTYIYVRPRNGKKSVDNWIPLSHFVWMQHNGRDFPKDHMCIFADHDNTNFDPDNLVVVPKNVYGLVTGGVHAKTLEYWDRESLVLAIVHAQLIMKRTEVERNKPRKCAVCGKRFRPTGKRVKYGQAVRTCDECLAQGKRAPMKRRKKAK